MIESRTTYFHYLALDHLQEMRLLFRGGKLWSKDNWRNVVEHSLVQVAASKVLAVALALSPTDTSELIKAAACHDWAKRLERRPQDFSQLDKKSAARMLAQINPDPDLLASTGPEFIELALIKHQDTFLQRLQFYIDDIARGSEIVPFDERIDEVERRRPDLNDDVDLTHRLGGRYFDRERQLGYQVEREIFDLLTSRGINLDNPSQIPNFIRSKIEENYLK